MGGRSGNERTIVRVHGNFTEFRKLPSRFVAFPSTIIMFAASKDEANRRLTIYCSSYMPGHTLLTSTTRSARPQRQNSDGPIRHLRSHMEHGRTDCDWQCSEVRCISATCSTAKRAASKLDPKRCGSKSTMSSGPPGSVKREEDRESGEESSSAILQWKKCVGVEPRRVQRPAFCFLDPGRRAPVICATAMTTYFIHHSRVNTSKALPAA